MPLAEHSPPGEEIPYIRQETGWTCGAACLCMAYRSLGAECTQDEIWSAIAAPEPGSRSGVKLHRLGRDAIERGFAAVAIQAVEPWAALVDCHRGGARVIFNQPLTWGSPHRHYSILTGVGDDHVLLHDPIDGPARRFAKDDWLGLWGARAGNPGALPHTLVAISRPETAPVRCRSCPATLPGSVPCPRCFRDIPIGPSAAVGCPDPSCRSRSWSRIFCPGCNWILTPLDGDRPTGSPSPERTMINPEDIKQFAEAMDRYQRKLSVAKGTVADAGLREQLGALQEHLKGSFAEFSDNLHKMRGLMDEQVRQADERTAALKVKAEQVLQQRDEAVARLAARRAEKAARAEKAGAKAVKEIDRHLGDRLRDKLLEEFGTRAEPTPTPNLDDPGSLLHFEPGDVKAR